jgi:hypothetical protein
MITKDFEETFLSTFEDYLHQKYPRLKVEIPASGSHPGGPTPDIIVKNVETGTQFAVELKSGFQSSHIPISALSQLRALRNYYTHQEKGDLVFITTGDIPEIVKHGLKDSGILYYSVRSPIEAVSYLDEKLKQLEEA